MNPVQAATEVPNKLKTTHLFGEFLVSKGILTRPQLVKALDDQRRLGGRLGEALLRLSMMTEEQVTQALAEHLSMEYFRFDDISKIDMNVARVLDETIAKRFCLVCVGEVDGRIIVAMADPLNVIAIDTITLKIKRPIKVVIGSAQEIRKTIELVYHGSDMEEQRLRELVAGEDAVQGAADERVESILEEAADGDADNSEAAAGKAPVIRFVDLLLSQAVKSRASDVHIEPQDKTMMIRMRIDGNLRDMVPPARHMQGAVLARIKILSNLNIAERRLPQDGRLKIKTANREIDVRVSTLPTIYGEKIVMRILDTSGASHNLDKLGMDTNSLSVLKNALSQPHGIMIVTGPTGSGKSTTLYSCLNYVKDPSVNITTVEDPVEYRLKGINQVQVKPEIDLTFASCLRSILRQDPDIILIGEIRDKETVEIAIKASLTGHLVLSTFHTNDAPSALTRLLNMGIEPYLLASSLNLVIAQRLVRKICDKCKEPAELDENVVKRLKLGPEKLQNAKFFKGHGCKYCGNTGYFGRLPIFEFLVMDHDMRDLVTKSAPEAQLRLLARQKGYGGLLESGISKMLQGLTTAEEVLGVTFSEDIGDVRVEQQELKVNIPDETKK
ncbi:MAG: Flp pilus assembly complex ATPase component TadA [Sedimentisphaerales bacterium]|nr:Flp pilus assembly complex ATPase component TadA [Sedimentisphaerales bacterium]